jgi:hypothetical protein
VLSHGTSHESKGRLNLTQKGEPVQGRFSKVTGFLLRQTAPTYRVTRFFDEPGLWHDVIETSSLQQAVRLLRSAGDMIQIIENGVLRNLTGSEQAEADAEFRRIWK